jgi:hypothetical protein
MSVGATDRFSRSISALLFSGDSSPLDDRICGGSWVLALSIASETFGKVAHPPPWLSMASDRKKKRKGLMTVNFTMSHPDGENPIPGGGSG